MSRPVAFCCDLAKQASTLASAAVIPSVHIHISMSHGPPAEAAIDDDDLEEDDVDEDAEEEDYEDEKPPAKKAKGTAKPAAKGAAKGAAGKAAGGKKGGQAAKGKARDWQPDSSLICAHTVWL